ncbi:MAG: hypothetical protein GX763_08605, partial [Clostridiaceae bacterium]|nr:hypothetical protein [Clostridiaceae bacterium]
MVASYGLSCRYHLFTKEDACMLETKSGSSVGNVGQGTWHFGEQARYEEDEIASIRAGIAAGMNLIDTAEMYGDGGAELLIGNAIRDLKREEIYLVSKIYPHNA